MIQHACCSYADNNDIKWTHFGNHSSRFLPILDLVQALVYLYSPELWRSWIIWCRLYETKQ
jgi:hypothetical protein